jgi:hypothetical protein
MTNISSADIICANGMPAFVACPDSKGPLPVVILMHERYGLVQHTRDQAMRCARDGFFVIAPNFFFRHPDQVSLNKGDGRYDMTDPESIELMDAAMASARTDKRADMNRVAIAGYCQTGRHPLVYAAQAKVQAVIVWYGAASKREWDVNARQPEALDALIARLPALREQGVTHFSIDPSTGAFSMILGPRLEPVQQQQREESPKGPAWHPEEMGLAADTPQPRSFRERRASMSPAVK